MKHLKWSPGNEDLRLRGSKAETALINMLERWDVIGCDQVGFEILIANLLSLLNSEGSTFELPHKLQAMRDAKLAKLPATSVYKSRSTLCHSLEALIGHIDFDRVRGCREANGSMMGSPSSTAAYLMHVTAWDDEAESYLRKVVTTLAEADVPFGKTESSTIATFLEEALITGNGTVGFYPSTLPDADDTAKTIIALRILGKAFSVDPLNPKQYSSQISKALTFICNQALAANVVEKWHLHELYWMMLLSQTYSLFYDRLREGALREELFDPPTLKESIPMVLLQVLIKTLQSQRMDGSWDGVCETTAYAVLTLTALSRVSCISPQLNNDEMIAAIQRGKAFLQLHRANWTDGSYLWIEKVTYASSILSEAYCLAAAAVPISPSLPAPRKIPYGIQPVEPLVHEMRKAGALLKFTPLFSEVEPHVLSAAELQACYVLPALQRQRLAIFPRTSTGEHHYSKFIPLTWTACSSLLGGKASLSVLYEMMVLTMLNYQVDEYMESDIQRNFVGDLGLVETAIQQLFVEFGAPSSEEKPKALLGQAVIIDHGSELETIRLTLARYITHILHHPGVLSSPDPLQRKLAYELETFLLAHLSQAEDNRRFRGQLGGASSRRANQKHTFYHWVRSTSADHTSCPFSFVFFNCLISASRSNAFATPRTAYIAEDLCRHLATLCRMYNDYGSVARDKDEGNLNSIDFPEFQQDPVGPTSDKAGKEFEQMRKAELLWLAEYERRGLDMAVLQLEEELGSTCEQLVAYLKLFIRVTDLYGQIYVQKDLTTRLG
ncbi:hypothetical protein DL764_010812 [Monosporascus ibericus]|uniref:Uncharacterized protein n=1 Tax=Monosporascus ibericus TaxID=155417 RepID=A0A4V1X8L2_9PEZI|nr:hypothetical protein DL764_010812 [Monosporascus ibericus]